MSFCAINVEASAITFHDGRSPRLRRHIRLVYRIFSFAYFAHALLLCIVYAALSMLASSGSVPSSQAAVIATYWTTGYVSMLRELN